jgi:hypothetical protein
VSNEYRFVDRPSVRAPVAAVYELVGDTLGYPRWWSRVFVRVGGRRRPAPARQTSEHREPRLSALPAPLGRSDRRGGRAARRRFSGLCSARTTVGRCAAARRGSTGSLPAARGRRIRPDSPKVQDCASRKDRSVARAAPSLALSGGRAARSGLPDAYPLAQTGGPRAWAPAEGETPAVPSPRPGG